MDINYGHVDDEEEVRFVVEESRVEIPAGEARLAGRLIVPASATGLVVPVYGAGDMQPVIDHLSTAWQALGLATLELKVPEVAQAGGYVEVQARRLAAVASWLRLHPHTAGLKLGYFGVGPLAAAALRLAGQHPDTVWAVVAIDSCPADAGEALDEVQAATLLLATEGNEELIELNQQARRRLRGQQRLATMMGPQSLLANPARWPDVGRLAGNWFARYL